VDLVSLCHAGLLCGRAAIAQAVGLDHQVVVGEEEVGLVAEDPVFRQGDREVGGEGERAEEDLEVGVGEPEGVAVEEGGELLDARLTPVPIELPTERLRIDQIELVRLVHRTLQAEWPQFGGEVDQGLDRVGDGDAVALDGTTGTEGGSAPHLEPLAPDLTLAPHTHVDHVPLPADAP
jgi:hypothetical protein